MSSPDVEWSKAHWQKVRDEIHSMDEASYESTWETASEPVTAPYKEPPLPFKPTEMQVQLAGMFAQRYNPVTMSNKNAFWFWDEHGNMGKSKVANVIKTQRFEDGEFPIVNMWIGSTNKMIVNASMRERACDVVFFDLTCSHSKNKMSIGFYDMLETLTNGWITATSKHESTTFRPPWIIVVANIPPDAELMRITNRFHVYDLRKHFKPHEYMFETANTTVETIDIRCPALKRKLDH